MICSVLAALTVTCHAQQCSRRVQIGNSDSGNLTISHDDVGQTCLDVAPPEDERKYVLLKLPASVSVSINGKTYGSADALHQHCFVMTPFKRCRLWHEKIQKPCPGGAIAKSIFGPTTVHIKTNVDSSQDGSNETTIGSELIHRYQGFFKDECTDLETPTVAPAVATTAPDPTTPLTSLINTAGTEDNLSEDELPTIEEADIPSTTEPSKTTMTIQSSTGTKFLDHPAVFTLLIILGIIAIAFTVGLVIEFIRKKARKSQVCCRSHDSEGAADTQAGTAESRHILLGSKGNANSSEPPVGSHDTVCFQQEAGGK